MKISVTKTDIRKGKRGTSTKCPIALALKRYGFKDVAVDDITIKVNGKYHVNQDKVADFVLAFDTGNQVRPFSFDLRPKID